jgi:hypothetical protein
MSAMSCVPTAVPSVMKSSLPVCSVNALKTSEPLSGVKKRGDDGGVGSTVVLMSCKR